jgi:hypothetical protein
MANDGTAVGRPRRSPAGRLLTNVDVAAEIARRTEGIDRLRCLVANGSVAAEINRRIEAGGA